MQRCIGIVALCACASAAPGDVPLWGIGNAPGDAGKAQVLYGLEFSVDFDNNAGAVSIFSSQSIVDQNGAPTSTGAYNPGLAYLDGVVYASNQNNSVAPELRTGWIDRSTGTFIGQNDQGITDPNPLPQIGGPFFSNEPFSNALVATPAGNPPDGPDQPIVGGITQDALQYGYDPNTGVPIGNIQPVPLPFTGFDPVNDVEGMATNPAQDAFYVLDVLETGNVSLLVSIDPGGSDPFTGFELALPFLDQPGFDNFGMTYDRPSNALIISATSDDPDGLPDTRFFALNADDLGEVLVLGDVSGAQIGGLASVPAPGAAAVLGLAGVAALRRRRA
jgi:hypothetical protein